MDAAYHFAKNLVNTKYERLPYEVISATKKQVLDLMGVLIGGFSMPGALEVRELVMSWGGSNESTVIGTSQKIPAANAAQANTTMAHALDYDDVHETAIIHPGVVIVPTCIAVAEQTGNIDGKELIADISAGVDMMCRLALATTPGTRPLVTGWHLTTLFGFIGSAGIAAKMLGLDEMGIVNAIGIAYHQCSGNGQCVIDGALTKRMGPGFAVRGGITSALLAQKGVTGAKDSLEGDMGLYNIYHRGHYDPEALTKELGTVFEGKNVAIKPYPCCRGIHPAIDSSLELVNNNKLNSEDIKKIDLFVSDGHYHLLCEPEEVKLKPRNPVDAQFSIPWGVATAISQREVGLKDFTEAAVKNRDILLLTDKMSIQIDPTLNRSDKIEPTRIEIETNTGNIYSAEVANPLGSMERPMSFDDCVEKFNDCANKLSGRKRNRAAKLISQLEEINDIGILPDLLNID